jgi:hypothetical protein
MRDGEDPKLKSQHPNTRKAARTMASPTIVIASGSSVTTWEFLNGARSFTFYPQGELPIADISWNHNGQGK